MPRAFDRTKVGARIAGIDWRSRGLHRLDDDHQLLARVHPRRTTFVTFAKVQYGVEMTIARDGELSLVDLDDGAGAANLAQWVFFPNNIVGIVRAQASPTVQQVNAFLRQEFSDIPDFYMSPLVRANAFETFSKMTKLTKVRFKLTQQVVADLPHGDFATAAQRLQQTSGATMIELTASVRSKKDRLTMPIRKAIASIYKQDTLDSSSNIVVYGVDEDGFPRHVSFTNNRFDFQIHVPAQKAGPPEESPVFLAILDLYRTNRAELDAAAQLDIELG